MKFLAPLFLFLSAMLAQAPDKSTPSSFVTIDKLAQEGRFAMALEVLRQSATEPGVDARAIEQKRKELFDQAKKRLQSLLDQAAGFSKQQKYEESIATLESAQSDFPVHKDFVALAERIEELRKKISEARNKTKDIGSASGSFRYEFPKSAPSEFFLHVEEGQRREKSMEWDLAREAYLRALSVAPDLSSKHLLAGMIEDVQRQFWFFSSLSDSYQEDPKRFAGVDLARQGQGDMLELTVEGFQWKTEAGTTPLQWKDISPESVQRLIARASLEPAALCDAVVFLYRQGLNREADLLLLDTTKKDPSQEEKAFLILSRVRREEPPSYGYVWFQNRWVSFREREEWKDSQELERKLSQYEKAGEFDRAPILEEWKRLGTAGRLHLFELLRKRRELAIGKLQDNGFLTKLKRIQALRTELDAKRKAAFALIFDEEKYFYPYRPPECPPEKAKLYPAVQAEVDQKVAAVRELWESAELVSLSGKVKEWISQMRMAQELLDQLGAVDSQVDSWVPILQALDTEDDSVQLRNFCWDKTEAKNWRDYNRKVLVWTALAATSSNEEERRQVAITNEYRMMMGLPALAVNEKLLQAARGHSKEMKELGYFSHFSPTPGRRTPFDRMKLQGYDSGVSENIAMGMSDAQGAHDGWIHSSGHHRNILVRFHREMGTGQDSAYWTQNFGQGREFEIDPLWQKE